MDQPLTAAAIRSAFGGTADLAAHDLALDGADATLFFLDGLTSSANIADLILRPARENLRGTAAEMLRDCLTGAVCAAVAKEAPDLDTACSLLVNGFAVLVIQGADRAVAFEVKSGEKRNPGPPSVEHTVQGAKDAFTETNRSNTNLLRRHLRSPLLRFREFPVGSKSHTNVTVVWLEGTTPPHLVRRLERRLRGLTVESFVTPAAVEEAVGGSRDTPFPLLRFTERPDKFAQALLDGQVGLFVDGLPLGYLAPVDLASFLTSPEDQAVDFVTASCIRVIRYAALLASLLLPGRFLGLAAFLLPPAALLLGGLVGFHAGKHLAALLVHGIRNLPEVKARLNLHVIAVDVLALGKGDGDAEQLPVCLSDADFFTKSSLGSQFSNILKPQLDSFTF